MKINVLDNRDIRSISRDELTRISDQLSKLGLLNRKLGREIPRTVSFYGWRSGAQYVTFDTEQEAWSEAEKQLGEGGGYRVQKVYL